MKRAIRIIMSFALVLMLTMGLVMPVMATQTEPDTEAGTHTIQQMEDEMLATVQGYPYPTYTVPDSAKAGETVKITGSGYPYKVAVLSVFSAETNTFLFETTGEEFTMPDEDIIVQVTWVPDGDPKELSLYTIKLSVPEFQGFTFACKIDKEQAHFGDAVTVEKLSDSDGIFLGVKVYDMDGNLLIAEDAKNNTASFYMPDSDVEVIPQVGHIDEPPVAYSVKIDNAKPLDGIQFITTDTTAYTENDTVHVSYKCTTEETKKYQVVIDSLKVYDTKGNLLFTANGDNFKMPACDVKVWVGARIIIEPGDYKAPEPITFKDVNGSTPHYKAIIWARDAGVTEGYSDGTFRPSQICSRGDMVMFIWNMMGKPAPRTVSSSPFKDLAKTHKYYKAILWAYQNGVTKGYSDGTFKTDKAVTRGETLCFLWHLKGSPNPQSTRNPFRDLAKTYVHYKAVLWGYYSGITKGYSDGTFRATNSTTRGEAVEFLGRYM